MSETVREVCAEMRDGEEGFHFPFADNDTKITKKVSNLLKAFADRIEAAHKREIADKAEEIAKLREGKEYWMAMYDALLATYEREGNETKRLRAAMKPVLKCDVNDAGLPYREVVETGYGRRHRNCYCALYGTPKKSAAPIKYVRETMDSRSPSEGGSK